MEPLNLPANMNDQLMNRDNWINIRNYVIRHRNEEGHLLDQNGNLIIDNNLDDILTGGNDVPFNAFGQRMDEAANNPIIIPTRRGFFFSCASLPARPS